MTFSILSTRLLTTAVAGSLALGATGGPLAATADGASPDSLSAGGAPAAATAPVVAHLARQRPARPGRPAAVSRASRSRRGTTGPTAPARPAGPSRPVRIAATPNWAALARCESTGDPAALSPDGRYAGLYQFDLPTWRSVGGAGSPAAASPAEQTRRAQLLYERVGRTAWPVCGRHL